MQLCKLLAQQRLLLRWFVSPNRRPPIHVVASSSSKASCKMRPTPHAPDKCGHSPTLSGKQPQEADSASGGFVCQLPPLLVTPAVGLRVGNHQRRGRATTVKARRRGWREAGARRGTTLAVAKSGPWVVFVGGMPRGFVGGAAQPQFHLTPAAARSGMTRSALPQAQVNIAVGQPKAKSKIIFDSQVSFYR